MSESGRATVGIGGYVEILPGIWIRNHGRKPIDITVEDRNGR